MPEKLPRSGERGEVVPDETDIEWEYNVRIAGPYTQTPFERVRHNETAPWRCWANGYYPDGSTHGCFEFETTEIGLCADHFEELIGHAPSSGK